MRRRHFLWAIPFAAAGLTFVLSGCKGGKTADPWESAGKRPKVLVSFAPLYSFASSVAGDDADVKCLMTSRGPHTHGDATAREIELSRGCDVFFINGIGLEEDADGIATKLQKVVVNPKWNVVNLGDKIDKSWLHAGGHEEGEEHDHLFDPHIWLSPRCAKKMVEGIRDELKRLDPGHAAGYDSRAAAYLAKLDRLEADGKAELAAKKNKWIVSFHDSLGYFSEAFGVKIADSIQIDPGKEPTDSKLEEIIQACKKHDARVIAVEPQFSDHTAARAIRDALRGLKDHPIDAVFAEVDPLETCDDADLSPELYEKVMRQNLERLAKSLQ